MMTNEELEIAKVGWNVAKHNLENNLQEKIVTTNNKIGFIYLEDLKNKEK